MEKIGLIIVCISVVVVLSSQISLYKQKKYIEQIVEDINHFLLYPEEIKEESLKEGYLSNLMNQIVKLESQILYNRKMSEKKETQVNCFIENMAHQMKTSITAIQIRLDSAFDLCADSQEKKMLIKSQECLNRLTNEVERLLIASQLAAGKVFMVYEKINIETILSNCMERLRVLAEKRNVKLILSGKILNEYCGDEFWLMQAFENVIKNAIEHTAEESNVQVSLSLQGLCINIQIEDEGEGIPDEELPFLFERFCRGNGMKKGYGIGLSMAKDIIQSHHGTINVGNRESGGARFLISLPILNGAEAYNNVRNTESVL